MRCPPIRRRGHPGSNRPPLGARRTAYGQRSAVAQVGARPSHRPRQLVYWPHLPHGARGPRDRLQHEPHGPLLRHRAGQRLLRKHEVEALRDFELNACHMPSTSWARPHLPAPPTPPALDFWAAHCRQVGGSSPRPRRPKPHDTGPIHCPSSLSAKLVIARVICLNTETLLRCCIRVLAD